MKKMVKIRKHIEGSEFEKCPGCIDRLRLTGIHFTPAPPLPAPGSLIVEAHHGPLFMCRDRDDPSIAHLVMYGLECEETLARLTAFVKEVGLRTEPGPFPPSIKEDWEKMGYKPEGFKFIRMRKADEYDTDVDG